MQLNEVNERSSPALQSLSSILFVSKSKGSKGKSLPYPLLLPSILKASLFCITTMQQQCKCKTILSRAMSMGGDSCQYTLKYFQETWKVSSKCNSAKCLELFNLSGFLSLFLTLWTWCRRYSEFLRNADYWKFLPFICKKNNVYLEPRLTVSDSKGFRRDVILNGSSSSCTEGKVKTHVYTHMMYVTFGPSRFTNGESWLKNLSFKLICRILTSQIKTSLR